MMKSVTSIENLDDRVTRHARTDFVAIGAHWTVQQALDSIRSAVSGGNFFYIYVTDRDGRLAGVIPTRKLLTAPLDKVVDAIMATQVIAIPDTFTLLDACEFFVLHRLLAFPVVDKDKRLLGVIDIRLFAEEMFDIQERDQVHMAFDTLGVRFSEFREQSMWSIFRSRFPWLVATIASGTACAVLIGVFELTLAKSLVLAFFMTLVLGLAESVAMQTMAIVTHVLHRQAPQRGWYAQTLKRELLRTVLLGVSCAVIVGCVVISWRGDVMAGVVIASGVLGSLLAASFLGVSIPVLLHRLKLDLRVATGPVTLALADICTIATYFSLAALIIGK